MMYVVIKRDEKVLTVTGPFDSTSKAKSFITSLDATAKFSRYARRASIRNFNNGGQAIAHITTESNPDVREYLPFLKG